MDFLNNINSETLLIVPQQIKEKILEKINEMGRLINVKIISFDELKKYICFDYGVSAILYLMSRYGYLYENAKMLIDNMYFVNDSNYKADKIKKLVKLKEEMINNKLLILDNLFLRKYFDKQVIVFGYDSITKFNSSLLSNFKHVLIIENDSLNICDRRVYKFKNMEDEVTFVVRSILDLLYEGVSFDKIKIINASSSYEKTLRRISSIHNIPIALEESSCIYGTKMVKDYIKYLESYTFLEAVKKIQNDYDLSNENNAYIFNKILNVSNKYNGLDYNKKVVIDAVKYELKHTSTKKKNYAKEIELVQLKDNYFDIDAHLFLLGFNQGEIPIIYKDEDYFSDKQKDEIGIDTSNSLNALERNSLIRVLSTYSNLTITYKERSGKEECYPSSFIEDFKYEVVSGKLDDTITYSENYDRIKFSIMLDNLIKFGIKDDGLELYFSNYVIPYLEYDNKFSGIDRDKLINMLKRKLVLSYSSIDNFYRCRFRYYIGNVLKLNKYEETFSIFIGKLFHDILSHSLDKDFNFNIEYDNYITKRDCNSKEMFFLLKLRAELEIIIKRLKELYNKTEFINVLSEKTIHIDKSTSNIEVDFMGIIDKIMYKEIDGDTLIAIIDYKTGNPNLNLFNAIYGIEMQLIIYMYLITKSKLFSRVKFVGIYLQKILSSEVSINKNKSYIELKNDNLKLQGYSIDNEGLISRFDPTYNDSEFIKGMKTTSNGFSSYTKLLSEEQIDALINLTDLNINNARDAILNGEFTINPKQIGNENVGCQFCEYRDICYKTPKDIVRLKEYDDLSFLGGDVNA